MLFEYSNLTKEQDKLYCMRFFFLILFLSNGAFIHAQLPENFSDQILDLDIEMAMGIEFDESGRMFIWEKAGRVHIVDTNGIQLPMPILDIHEEVGNWRDHGLLGFALDPNFFNNGHFYLLYAVDRHYLLHYGTSEYNADSTSTNQASIGRVTRYTADAASNYTQIIMGSRKILLGEDITTGIPLYHESHGIGSLIFGEDETLLISCGDGNSNQGVDVGGDTYGSYAEQALADGIISEDQDIGSFKSQYLGSLNGKVLRIDPETGDGIPSNPFYDSNAPRSAASRTWVYGFRNPFRMILIENTGSHNPEDADPGTLFIGDVGASRWEELNIAEKGGLNFGWPFKEGLSPFWGFWTVDQMQNPLAPNPLFNGGSCSEEYFNFKDLFAEARENGEVFFPNPCNENIAIPSDANPRMETIPILTWGHNEWNLPTKAYIGIFDDEGTLKPIDITSAESPIESEAFDGNSSITGTFYHGDNFPEEYKGLYFHADFSGWIRTIQFDAENNIQKITPFHDATNQIIQIVEHPSDGCLYYTTTRNGGDIRKICYGGNPLPVAIAKADTIYGPSPLTVNFDASDSYDPFGLPITYHWDFGDGEESTSVNPFHEFVASSDSPTPFTVKLTVTDSLGASHENTLIISLNNTPPQVEIIDPKNGSFYSMNGNTLYTLDADVTDLEHSSDALTYEWQTFLHHNSHQHPETPVFEKNPQVLITPVGCEDDANYWFRIRLKVTDAAGLETIRDTEIYPYCGPDFFEIINLEAVAITQAIDLSFEVTLEDDVDRYEIQRGPFFETLESIPSNGLGSYNFTDLAPLFGENFYRIKAVKSNGLFDYSNTVKILFPPKADFSIFPNPATDIITIELKEVLSNQVSFELFDATGKQVSRINWPVIPGNPLSENILSHRFAKGVFFFRLIDGDRMEEGKIVIWK